MDVCHVNCGGYVIAYQYLLHVCKRITQRSANQVQICVKVTRAFVEFFF